jgi:hypothetical protein
MDVLRLRRSPIDEYAGYIESFVRVPDERIVSFVGNALDGRVLWPEPLIQLNPSGSLWH